MKFRPSRLRVLVAALLVVSGLSSTVRASSISASASGPALLQAAAPPPSGSLLVLPERHLSIAAGAEAANGSELAAAATLISPRPQTALLLNGSQEFVVSGNLSQAAPAYLSAAVPLTVSDVPEPTAFGLLLFGLAGLFAARRVARRG